MIVTERLLIRSVQIDDWKSIQMLWVDQAKSIYAPYIKPKALDNQSVFQEIVRWVDFTDNDEHHYFVVCCDKTVMGYVALHRRKYGFEIGYGFHSGYQGKGYAKESVSAILDFMKAQGIARIVAQTALKNMPSIKLLLSLGFKQIGTKKISFYKDAEGKNIVFDDGIFELQIY